MNTLDAAHRIGLEYPGGIKALAVRMGISPGVLVCKLNPNTATHHLTMIEAQRLMAMTERYDVLHAMADELGFVCVAKNSDALDAAPMGDIGHALAHACAEFGIYLNEVDVAMKDGRITANERKRLEAALTDMVSAATALQSKLSSKK